MVAACAVIVCVPASLDAHGMQAVVEDRSVPAVTVRCEYSNGTPVDAEVLVHSPAEPARIFQRLRTDLRGRASFVPDAPGQWRIVADDGLGHRTELDLSVDDDGVAGKSPAPDAVPAPMVSMAVLLLAGGAWWAVSRRRKGQ